MFDLIFSKIDVFSRHRSPSDADIDRERAERRQRVDSRRSDSRDHHDSGRHDGKRDDRRSARDLSPPRTVSKTKSQQDDAEERQYKYPSPPRYLSTLCISM
jgi:hypothetical protein